MSEDPKAEANRYVRRACFDGHTSLYWAITGATSDGSAAGVMAWCYDEADATDALRALRATGDYRNLTIENLGPS